MVGGGASFPLQKAISYQRRGVNEFCVKYSKYSF
jgi:hypothetical protein